MVSLALKSPTGQYLCPIVYCVSFCLAELCFNLVCFVAVLYSNCGLNVKEKKFSVNGPAPRKKREET